MGAGDVLVVLDRLADAGCRVWISGGWGVDALVGRQSRTHRDLDLAVDATDEVVAMMVLESAGFVIETDWRPVRVELAASGRQWVDLHPVMFRADGVGIQSDLGGGQFVYPPGCFVSGAIGGRGVPCLSVDQQIAFHTGYEPRAVDRADLELLDSLRGRDRHIGTDRAR